MSLSHYEECPRCRSRGNDQRGDNLAVYDDGGYHCFACGLHKGAKFLPPSTEVKKEVGHGEKGLPADFTREVPARAWKWLLQYGLGFKYWREHVGWSEQHSRLIFTFSDFAAGRYIPGEGPPSVALSDRGGGNRPPSKWFTYGNSHRTAQVFRPNLPGASDKVILVEDPISAHKVGFIQTCIPLFGTEIFDACIPVLRHLALPITLWLDADQQGTAQRKAARLSVLTGLPATYIFTKADPKALSLNQIQATVT